MALCYLLLEAGYQTFVISDICYLGHFQYLAFAITTFTICDIVTFNMCDIYYVSHLLCVTFAFAMCYIRTYVTFSMCDIYYTMCHMLRHMVCVT